MGTIEHRGRNSWRVGFRLGTAEGRRWIRRTLTFDDSMSEDEQRHAAEVELARLIVEADDAQSAGLTPPADPTVADLAEVWIREHVDIECKPTTAEGYKSMLRARILPTLGKKKVSALRPFDFQLFVNGLRKAKKITTRVDPAERKRGADRGRVDPDPAVLSDSTVRHCYDTLNYMFNQCVAWQLIPRNPLESVPRPKARRRRRRFLDDEQAVRLLRCLSGEELSFRCAVLLALLCGLRLGEVVGLRLDDVDWDRSTIRIAEAVHYVPGYGNYYDSTKTEASDRVVTLPEGMMVMLREMRRYQSEVGALLGESWLGDGRIVCAWNGKPLHHDTPSKQFRRFADRNGFQGVRFHDLRHAHASILLANNIDAVSVAARLGHDSAETTLRIYAHAIASRDRGAAAAMQQLVDISGAADGDLGAPKITDGQGNPIDPATLLPPRT